MSIDTLPKHTPGPWEVDVAESGQAGLGSAVVRVDVTKDDQRIAGVTVRPGSKALSNARLIAAAPDMLSVLRKIRRGDFPEREQPLWEEIQAAIAKATKDPQRALEVSERYERERGIL